MDDIILRQDPNGDTLISRVNKFGIRYDVLANPIEQAMYYPLIYKGQEIWVSELGLIQIGLVDMLRAVGLEINDL